MARNERNRERISERYKGVDSSELTIIPAKPPKTITDGRKRRVAAYIRVSTDNDEQKSSFELQKNHYTEYVKAQPGWELIGIYADEGISGTQIKHREALQTLLRDCDAGKVDYIITKAISRIARNAVDCLNIVEHLSNLNPPVGIIFESDHIDTLSSVNALLLTILASLAEAESRTKSDIMEWSVDNRFRKGIFLLPELIGFDKDEDGNLVINDDEADTVRICFYLFLSGYTPSAIAEILTAMGRKTGYNKQHNKKPGVVPEYNTSWTASSVQSILRNERHCGDVLARKTYTPNFKTHKSRKNRGERTQVYKRGDHEAIVPREVFEAVNRKLDHGKSDNRYPTMKVIDDGALRGFVPVDRTWSGFSSEDFKVASKSVYEEDHDEAEKEQTRRSNFRVVSAQLFSTKLYPAVTISKGKIRFNSACMKRFEDVEYVELLFNAVEKCLAVRPCEKDNANAIQWGSLKDGKWVVKERSCRGFSTPLYETMGWNEELRYRMRGSFMGDSENKVMIFDLEEPEVVERVLVEDIPTEPDGRGRDREEYGKNTEEVEEVEEVEKTEEKSKKPRYKNITTFPHNGVVGPYLDDYLKRVHYSGDWDVLRPAREVIEVNLVSDERIDGLLMEAEAILERWRVTA